MRRSQRGAALAVTIGVALICSIAAYTILMVAFAQIGPGKLFRERVRSRFAAEAALVWAADGLRQDPNWTPPGDFEITDYRGRRIRVVVTLTPDARWPWQKKIEAHVFY